MATEQAVTTLSAAANTEATGMLGDLEQNTGAEIRRRRAHDRVVAKARLVVVPGNCSQRRDFKAQGVTGDVSPGGCNALLPVPLSVGDIYLLEFDRGQLDLPPTLGRCVRCRLIRDDAFEAGFAFFSPVNLPAAIAAGTGSEVESLIA